MSDAAQLNRLSKWPIVAVGSRAMEPPHALTGEQIRRAREARRMTQQELADALGVGLRSVGRWERGESVPRSAIGALTEILDIDPPTSEESGPLLRDASPAELLAELARRMEAAPRRPAHEDLPDVPTGRYRLPKSRGPTARTRKQVDDTSTPDQQSM